ncbi:hypothetical protein [Desulfocicer niacini]
MKKSNVLLILFLCFGLPLLICVIFKILPIGSVGPIIPITGIINVFALPYLFYCSVADLVKSKGTKVISLIVSILIGVFMTVIEMNVFIGLSSLFGIMDYHLM